MKQDIYLSLNQLSSLFNILNINKYSNKNFINFLLKTYAFTKIHSSASTVQHQTLYFWFYTFFFSKIIFTYIFVFFFLF